MRALSIDFEPEAQPAWWRVLVASVVAIVGSLIADALIAAAAIAIWPHLKGYQHFLFTDYATLTIIGVIGGDGAANGPDEHGAPWRVGVEDPFGGKEPLCVIELTAGAWATSSVRVRTWQVGDRAVHHLIDPSTGLPGGAGLAAVTVLGDSAMDAEVDAKVGFLAGADGIDALVARLGLTALWVYADGGFAMAPSFGERVVWQQRPPRRVWW